jgi:hypothetical protein
MTTPFKSPMTTMGAAEHAAAIAQGRHPDVATALAWLAFSHLPPKLQNFSRPFYQTAVELVIEIPNDSAELIAALNRLVEAKDWAVRAGIRSDQGVPGPVPRPATVVDPPVGNYGPGQPRTPGEGPMTDPPRPRPVRDNPQA